METYICTEKKDFNRIKEHYVLIPLEEGCWKATDQISYSVIGFKEKNKKASFDGDYQSKASAMNFVRKAIKEKRFQCIVLRKKVEDLRNNEFFNLSVDTPIKQWELQ